MTIHKKLGTRRGYNFYYGEINPEARFVMRTSDDVATGAHGGQFHFYRDHKRFYLCGLVKILGIKTTESNKRDALAHVQQWLNGGASQYAARFNSAFQL